MTIKEDSDRHNLYLQKLAEGLFNNEVYPSIEAARKDVRLILLDQEELRSNADVIKVQAKITKAVNELYDLTGLNKELLALADYEAQWQVNALSQYTEAALAVPAGDDIARLASNTALSLTSGQSSSYGKWSQYLKGSKDAMAQQYNGAVLRGYQSGQTVGQIAKEIKGLSDKLLTNQARTLARTGMSHYASAARDSVMSKNKAVKYRVFSATFDNRTTDQCRDYDGDWWHADDDNYPRLPLHHGERSSYYFATDKSQIGEGRKVEVGGQGDKAPTRRNGKKPIYRGKRDGESFDAGTIPANMSQDQWLKEQPRWFVETSLGKTRAKLFLDGDLKIGNFVDMQGKRITLEDLRKLDSEAFKRAGL